MAFLITPGRRKCFRKAQDENEEVSCMAAQIYWFALAHASLCCSVGSCNTFVPGVASGPRT